MPLFKTETGENVVLCDKGLCYGPESVEDKDLKTDTRFDGILPAGVNPKPKKATGWNYKLNFENKCVLQVQSSNQGGRFSYRVNLSKKNSNARQT